MSKKPRARIDDYWNIDGLETCRILGQVSHNLLYWKKNLTENCGPVVRSNKKTAYIQARSSMARALEVNGKECQAEGEAKVVWEKLLENARKLREDLFQERNSKKPSRTRVRSWKHQCSCMPMKIMKKNCGSGGQQN